LVTLSSFRIIMRPL